MMMPRWISGPKVVGFARIGITLASFAVLAQFVSGQNALRALSKVDPLWLAAALAIFIPAQLVNAQRFRYIAAAFGGYLSFRRAASLHFIRLWFNQVLPTSVGGDAIKAFLLRRDFGTSVAIRATILDRASGLLIVLVSIVLLSPLYFETIGSSAFVMALFLGSAASLGILIGLSWYCANHQALWRDVAVLHHVCELLADFYRFRTPSRLFQQASLSLVMHGVGIASYLILGHALNLHLRLLDYILLAPLVFLFAAIPLSFASWGVREIGAVWLFGLVGTTPEEAFALSVLYGLLCLVGALPGAMLALRMRPATP
jgi:uncharacterized protein (TIRG00374 family)